jgi:phosphoglycolate phosphatase
MTGLGSIEAIAFDLDGTLVDSAPDIAAALDAALSREGLSRFDLNTVRRWIGDGPDALILRALAAQGLERPSEPFRARLRSAFEAHTLAAPLACGQVFDGVTELLAQLFGRYPMAVVTNKPTRLAQAVLEAAGLSRFIATVHGADTAELRKPAPALLFAAAQQLRVPCERLLMVGDSATDMLAAHHAGCPAALVAWGYGSDAVPDHLRPWRVAEAQHLLHGLMHGRQPALTTF